MGFGYRCAQIRGGRIGRYIVTKKDNLEFVYDTLVGANGGADGEEKVLTAFLRASSVIVSVRR